MRVARTVACLMLLGLGLAGCAVAEAGGDVVDAGVTVAGAAVDATGDAAGTVTGSSDSASKKN